MKTCLFLVLRSPEIGFIEVTHMKCTSFHSGVSLTKLEMCPGLKLTSRSTRWQKQSLRLMCGHLRVLV